MQGLEDRALTFVRMARLGMECVSAERPHAAHAQINPSERRDTSALPRDGIRMAFCPLKPYERPRVLADVCARVIPLAVLEARGRRKPPQPSRDRQLAGTYLIGCV